MEKKKRTIIITVAVILLLLLLSLAIALPLALRGKDETEPEGIKVTVTTELAEGSNGDYVTGKWFLKFAGETTEHAESEEMSFSLEAGEEAFFGIVCSIDAVNGQGGIQSIEYDGTKIELMSDLSEEQASGENFTSEVFEGALGTADWKDVTSDNLSTSGYTLLLIKIKVKESVTSGNFSINLVFEAQSNVFE